MKTALERATRAGSVGLAAVLLVFVVFAAPRARAEEWFDAYEAGLRLLRQEQGARAAERFERAIRQQPEPGRNVLTYGTNRLAAYYPYLRLAEAWLLAGDPERARAALERSRRRVAEPADERERLLAQVADLAARHAAERLAAASTPAPAAAPTAPPVTAAAAPPATPAPVVSAAEATPMPPAPPAPAPASTAGTGTLDVRSEPPGASVFAGERYLGTTPLAVELPAGRHTITLRKDGSAEQRFDVRLGAGRRVSETRTLAAVAGAASSPAASAAPERADSAPGGGMVNALIIYSRPAGAVVYLDDEPLGRTDPVSGRLVKTGLTPGPHSVRLSAAGHGDWAQSVEVAASGPTSVRADLAAAPASGLPLVALVVGLFVAGAAAFVLLRRRRAAATAAAAPGAARPLGDLTTLAQTRGAAPPTGRATPGAPAGGTATPGRPTAVPPTTLPDGGPFTGTLETHALAGLVEGQGEAFGDYRLLEVLGKGGMATVYKAERHGEVVALKRPLPGFLEEAEFLTRFMREADIGRALHHPNIVRIVDRGAVGRVPFFTMELVPGETLQAYVRRHGRLEPRAAARVVAQVAEALDYAHLKGVVHRDLKPSNIMVLRDAAIKVMDYGIARARRFDGLTVTGHFLGTPDYVAPETAEGRGTDARSDLYSLGVVFYEIITGRRPFVGDTPFATLRKHCSEPPLPPSQVAPGVPPELEAVILKLLAKEPGERHPGAEELLIELRDYLNRAA